MGTYDPAEPLTWLVKKLEKGREFVRAGGQTIDYDMMVSKGITLLSHASILNEDIREQRHQTTVQNPAPKIPLVKLGNWHKEALRILAKIIIKANPPAVPPKASVREVFQEKLQKVNR